MMRCALDDHFELYEFPNDLARWCWEALGDDVLGEELGLVDPYQHPSVSSLRTALDKRHRRAALGRRPDPVVPAGARAASYRVPT